VEHHPKKLISKIDRGLEIGHSLDLPPPIGERANNLGRGAVDMVLAWAAASKSEPREFYQEKRREESERKRRASEVAKELLAVEGTKHWILPSTFLEYVSREAGVDVYTAQFVLDNLRSEKELEFVIARGVRSKTPSADFLDQDLLEIAKVAEA
jgi:hypothetical protein